MINKLRHIVLFIIFLGVIAFFSYYCANPRPPAGGPEDIYPPMVMKTEPGNYSANFRGNRIQLFFDEFVKLNDVTNQVFISPPQYEMPEFVVRGKSVIIEFKDELLENTTYNIFFGEAIVDITENNPLENYSFVFATGDKVDSLVILGEVRNAFTLAQEPGVLVMLYNEHYDTIPLDSVPYLVRPVYVTKTYDDGKFALNSLKGGNYKMFALKDINNNFVYDQPGELIAFLDSLVSPYYPERYLADTLADSLGRVTPGLDTAAEPRYAITIGKDTIGLVDQWNDTITSDTVTVPGTMVNKMPPRENIYPYYPLMLFQEIDSAQRLLYADLSMKALLKFVFRYPARNPLIELIEPEYREGWKIDEWNARRDTLQCWLLKVEHDSALFRVADDTLVLDTVELPLRREERKGLFGRREEKPPEVLKFKQNIKDGQLDYPGPLKFYFTYPLVTYDFSGIRLVTPKDTLYPEVRIQDSTLKRSATIDYTWKEKTSYALIIPDSVMTDMIGRHNDSLLLTFTTKSLEDYGILILNVNLPEESVQYIIQLLNEREAIIEQRTIAASAVEIFRFLEPQKYKLKAIRDGNRNGRWDTGDYLSGLQPEPVYYFIKVIDVRPNWELEENWEIE